MNSHSVKYGYLQDMDYSIYVNWHDPVNGDQRWCDYTVKIMKDNIKLLEATFSSIEEAQKYAIDNINKYKERLKAM